MPGLTLSHISKKYDDVTAVADVDLDVADGEFVALLGPSGCGKSTTLRMVAGFEAPTTGSVRIGDRLVSSGDDGISVPSNRRDIGLVFQSYALWPHMTVGKNVGYGLRTRKVSKDELASRVREALDLVHMADYIDRYPSELSGGQQQRVALARAVAYNPSLLLLDEPLSNLDAKLRERMRLDICELQQRLGLTALYVTHDQAEAMSMSDRIALMCDGVLHQVGAPEDVYANPRTPFVARFIGTSNLIDCRAQDEAAEGGRPHVKMPDGTVLIGRATTTIALNQAVVACVRAESIRVSTDEPTTQTETQWHRGTVSKSSFFGDTREYLVEVFGSTLQVRTSVGRALPPGAEAWLGIDPDDLIVIGSK
ncbi:polyamine ABC transporter ATP-binding protein [Mycolicibacterium agri]|uniref:Trehalose import ATP-binding protein SugC n=1 Tax=Mycolicibacterium agri TaxID=36811 RepID=A0A2A7N3W4_MYCAG|nr:ABC transporter ATP-binding protein [Mycolicibacterium agri]PEG38211.1 polyamine ABC transporter ATP-binding protein [Mycolicibacterium agri]GFG49323.1 spermidine/putrescine ABC transporter ATP-binding protein [Mycolicibacterium agri]